MTENNPVEATQRASREPTAQESQWGSLATAENRPVHAINEMVTGIAHEVRNPLGVLLMGTDYLAKKLQGDAVATGVIEDMRNAIARTDAIVSALPDLSPADRRPRRAENLNVLVESSLRRVADDAEANRITVVREFAADLPPLLLDAKKCQQAVVHLLNNAIEAMPAGGTLTLQTLRAPGAVAAGEGAVSLRISDTGRGVPPQMLGKVFDAFFSAEKSERNAGLGLTVAREIIHAHGGTISIGNGAAGGARVSVTLAGSSRDAEGREPRAVAEAR